MVLGLDCAEQFKRVDPARGALLQSTVLAMAGRWIEAQPCFDRALGAEPQNRLQAKEALRLLPAAKNRARPLTAICDALLDADQIEEAWRVAATTDAPA
jgi:hypothetical protein